MRTILAKDLVLEMLSLWMIALGAWGLIHAAYLSASFFVGSLSLSVGSTLLLTRR